MSASGTAAMATSCGAMTRHAEKRLRQRGCREVDVAILLQLGTRVADNTFVLTDNIIERQIHAWRRRITDLERLRGLTAIVEGDNVVTVYRQSRGSRRRGLRGED